MVVTTARIKKTGKNFEIQVDLDKALEFKGGSGSVGDFLEIDAIFYDSKKGERAKSDDLKSAFGTEDVNEIAETIVKQGEILLTQEHRDKEQGESVKKIVDFLSRNAVDPQTNTPYTPDRITSALKEAGVNIKNKPVEEQITEIIEKLSKVVPIKIETKKIKLTVPAIHTGKAYGLLNQYKEKEEWLPNGDLVVIVNIPAGMQMEFYDKINSMTHGSVLSEEIKED